MLCRHAGPRRRAVGCGPRAHLLGRPEPPPRRGGPWAPSTQHPPLPRTDRGATPRTSPLTCKRLLLRQNPPDHDGKAGRKPGRSVSVREPDPRPATRPEEPVSNPQQGEREDAARDVLKQVHPLAVAHGTSVEGSDVRPRATPFRLSCEFPQREGAPKKACRRQPLAECTPNFLPALGVPR